MRRAALAIGLLGAALFLSSAHAQEGEYHRLLGTRVSMVRPKFFMRTEFGMGYVFPNAGARVQVTEYPRPLSQVLEGYSNELIDRSGFRVKAREEVEIDGNPGLFLHTAPKSGSEGLARWTAVFGNEQATVVIDASGAPGSEEALDVLYRKALLGARWEPKLQYSPYEGLPFILAGRSRFKFAARYGTALTFTLGGKPTRETPDDPILVVTTIPQQVPEEARAEFCTQRIQASPVVKDLELVASGEVEVDGIKGCEALARAMDKQSGRPMMVYEANLFEGSRYYNFNGLAGVRFRAEYVSEFARTARRIRRK